jgi:hypothetical protein
MLRTHTGEVWSDHFGTLYSGCNRESARGQLAQVRLCPLAVCVQCARDRPEACIASACVCEEKECHRPGRLWPLPGDSVNCKQSNSVRSGERSGERSEGYYKQQQGRKPLRHLGMSRGDVRQAFAHTFC